MRFWVRIYQHGKDYSAMAPDLPGCVAAGDSVEDVRDLIAEAIRMHLDLMRQSGEKIPVPTRHLDIDVAELEDGEMCTWVNIKATPDKIRRKQRVGGTKG
jgi:predicted RNase H-like HicB family nuclease